MLGAPVLDPPLQEGVLRTYFNPYLGTAISEKYAVGLYLWLRWSS